jgi:hypothetical protein
MAIYKIYKISDSLSEYIYLGYTSLTLTDTLNLHIANANNGKNSELYSHMRKIGTENFKIELVRDFNYTKPCDILEKVKNKYNPDLLLKNNFNTKAKPKVEEVKCKKGICFSIRW